MNQNSDNFIVESTPVLDLKKQGFENHSEPGMGPAQSWDADRTEVYADIEDSDALGAVANAIWYFRAKGSLENTLK